MASVAQQFWGEVLDVGRPIGGSKREQRSLRRHAMTRARPTGSRGGSRQPDPRRLIRW